MRAPSIQCTHGRGLACRICYAPHYEAGLDKVGLTATTVPVPDGRIEVHPQGGATITGKSGIELTRLIVMRSAFKLWIKTGMQPTRGVRIKKLVQETTGLRTSKNDALLERLELMIAEAEGRVVRVGAAP